MISRKETIFRAGQESAVLEILETTYCILETKPLLDGAILEDGFYLCRAWGGGKHAAVGKFYFDFINLYKFIKILIIKKKNHDF